MSMRFPDALGLVYGCFDLAPYLLRTSFGTPRTSSGGAPTEGRRMYSPPPKGTVSGQGNGRHRHKGVVSFKSSITPVTLPLISSSSPNANQRKKGDKSELKRL